MNHAKNLREFANNFPARSLEANGLDAAADEIERLENENADLANDLCYAHSLLRHLREHNGECLGDHPDWLRKIDRLLATEK